MGDFYIICVCGYACSREYVYKQENVSLEVAKWLRVTMVFLWLILAGQWFENFRWIKNKMSEKLSFQSQKY